MYKGKSAYYLPIPEKRQRGYRQNRLTINY